MQQFRGWTEKHAWAWIFTKGKPTCLSFTIKDGKVLASGKLTFDPQKELYRLEGKEPGARGKVISFEGKLDSSGKQLVLDQTHEETDPLPADGQLRISLRPNANFLRYTMTQDRKAPGAAVFTRTIEVGVTKEGETFAAGASATERPKCIVTGGAGHDVGDVRRSRRSRCAVRAASANSTITRRNTSRKPHCCSRINRESRRQPPRP